MSIITNTVSKRITKSVMGKGLSALDKLVNKTEKNNVKSITFPHDLQNQAECTYMVIYIMDNTDNNLKYSTDTFNSGIDKTSYEIPAVTFLKDYAQQEFKRLTEWAKDTGKSWVKDAGDYLKDLTGVKTEDVEKLKLVEKAKEAGDWAKKWLVPRKITTGTSKSLQDKLDPTKSGNHTGYKITTAISLQMPSSEITYTYENGWESTNTSTLNTIMNLINGVKNYFGMGAENDAAKKQMRDTGKAQVGDVMTKVGDAVGDLVTGGGFSASRKASNKRVDNPCVVFNYSIPQPRTFSYSFTLYPRNKEELYTLFNMIQELKFYSLPESGGKDNAMFYRYPAQFAVKFYTNGYENKWFPKTMALGLTEIEETLTGENGDMAYFENYFDKESGNPPRVIKLNLKFKELGIMSREYAQAGY